MEFRRAEASEGVDVMAVLSDGRESIRQLGIDQWQLGYPHKAIVDEDIDLGQCYVMTDEICGECERIVATAAAVFTGEHTYDEIYGGEWLTDSTSSDPTYCTVHRVAVSKHGQGRGYAKKLFANIEELARQSGSLSIRVDTHPGNLPMRGLLNSMGYEECGIIYIDHAGEDTPDRVAFEKLL